MTHIRRVHPSDEPPYDVVEMRVLLVEDSVRLAEAVALGLRNSGYAVDVATDGQTGLRFATAHDYDVVVLDLMLPAIDGLTVLKRLREGGHHTHVLVLTARDAVDDRVRGLRAGADDYLVKPFAFDELLARIEALVRRRHAVKNPVVKVRGLAINTAARTVTRGGVAMELPARQYALLEYLVLNAGRVISRAEIESHLYDAHAEPMSNVVDATIYALRKRIDLPDESSLIQTRRGMGYLFAAEADAGEQ